MRSPRVLRLPGAFVHRAGAGIAPDRRMFATIVDFCLFVTDRCRTAVLAILALALGRLGLAMLGVRV